MQRLLRLLVLAALLAPTLLAAPCAVLAQQRGATQQQRGTAAEISQSQRRLQEIRRERARLRTELQTIRSRVSDATGELRNIERQVSASAAALRELEFQAAESERQIERTTRELTETQQRLEQRTEVLHRRLVEVYKRGPLRAQEVMLTASSFSELLNRYKYLYLLTRRDQGLRGEVLALRDELVAQEQALLEHRAELESLRQQKLGEHAELARLEQQRRRALSSFQAREAAVRRQEQQLAQDERRLTNLIAELERRRREAERREAERREAERRRAAAAGRSAPAAPAARGPTISAAARGSLAWPLDGRLIYRYGRVVQPNGTAVRMNGIGIAASPGSPVRAVEAGTVMLASPFEGYGPTVVVSHGGGYYSLYLHLREMSVAEGAQVTRGQVVGTVGGNGRAEGAHIEFQLRAPGGEAVDPLPWLRPLAR